MVTIYAEKPSVAKTIVQSIGCGKTENKTGYILTQFKGEPCCVTWGVGHLCELKQAVDYNSDYKNWKNLPLPFVPASFETKIKTKVKEQAKIVENLFKKSDWIINAADADREGELIFYYLMQTLKCKTPFKRVILKSYEKSAVIDAFDNLLSFEDVKDITDAARARGVADFLVGSNLTVAMTLSCGTRDVLSIGRVQTPTLNILVQREKEIRAFSKTLYYEVSGNFVTEKDKAKYSGMLDGDRIFSKEEADKIAADTNGGLAEIIDIEKTVCDKSLPYLYNLSGLQMDANGVYGFSLDKTLKTAQSLYEKGLITYPRTDSVFLTKDMAGTVKGILEKLKSVPEYSSLISSTDIRNFGHWFNDSKVKSHTAIIPTKSIPSSLSPDEKKIYDLVCRSVIYVTCNAAKIEKTTVKTQVNGYIFISKGSVVVDKQWLAVSLSATKETFLPVLSKGEKSTAECVVETKETKPPKRYTDKTLVAAMNNAGKYIEDEEYKKILDSEAVQGIGTEATRAGILQTLIAREYVVREKKTLVPTEKGMFLIDAIPIDEIKSPIYTAQWERRLSLIADAKDNYDSFVSDIIKQMTLWCSRLTSSVKSVDYKKETSAGLSCPLCSKPLIKYKWGWGCSGYKNGCKFSVNAVIAGKKITDANVKALIKKKKTGKISGFKSKAGKPFTAALVMDKEGKISFSF